MLKRLQVLLNNLLDDDAYAQNVWYAIAKLLFDAYNDGGYYQCTDLIMAFNTEHSLYDDLVIGKETIALHRANSITIYDGSFVLGKYFTFYI